MGFLSNLFTKTYIPFCHYTELFALCITYSHFGGQQKW